MDETAVDLALAAAVDDMISQGKPDFMVLTATCTALAFMAQKDMSWKQALASARRGEIITALQSEKNSLGRILTKIFPDDPKYSQAVAESVSGRYLLDERRSGQMKVRGVKQGFKEDKALADGPDFTYYAHTVKLNSVRAMLFRKDRGVRRLTIKDVSTAFLQSHKYPDGMVKFVHFKDPVINEVEYFEQNGPIYGEASAVRRWEDTICPWLEDLGFDRGCNDPGIFFMEDRDLLNLLFVDDNIADGKDEEVDWFLAELDNQYDCKPGETLSKSSDLDYLGMEISIDDDYLWLCMQGCIQGLIKNLHDELGVSSRKVRTPIDRPIDPESEPLNAHDRRLFMTGVGAVGWLNLTARPDISLAHSRVAQHMENPTVSAMESLKRTLAYLVQHDDLALRSNLHPEDVDVSRAQDHAHDVWEFYTDSDHIRHGS